MTPKLFGRARVLCVLLAITCTSACMMHSPRRSYGGGVQTPRSSGMVPPSRWSKFRVADTLEIALPARPQWRQERRRADDGAQLETTIAESAIPFPRVGFQIFVTKFEGGIAGDLTDQLDHYVDGFLEATEGMEVRDADTITTNGYPGYELSLVNAETHRVVRARHYIGRTRAYAIVAYYDESPSSAQIDRLVTEFFQEITLVASDAPVPAGDARYDPAAWTGIYPPEDDFAIDMPGRAQTATEHFVLGEDNSETTEYRVGAPGAPRFSVSVTPIGDIEPEGLLGRLRDQRLSQGYRIRESRDSVRQGYASLAVVYESGTDVVYSLFVITLSRIYEARVAVPRADEAQIVPNRQRFFQSLRIL